MLPEALIARAADHIRAIAALALEHDPARPALIVSDARSPLALALAEAWRRALPSAAHLDFDAHPPEAVLAAFAPLRKGDLAVLIQSSNFRLAEFRLRVDLFKRGLKVVEHPHLERMDEREAAIYVEALAYDPAWYRGVGHALRERIDASATALIHTGAAAPLAFAGAFEPAKPNLGDYRGMANVGGLFPIGEVFTEARDVEAVGGLARVFCFAGEDFMAKVPTAPITLRIARGRVVEARDSTPEFDRVLGNIRADEGEVWVRELGFGMNRAFAPDRIVRDIGTLERMVGIHLSLGAKHAVYKKAAFNRREARHHVDVFLDTKDVLLDGVSVFRNGTWDPGQGE